MHHSEMYKGVKVDIHTSVLASQHISFAVYLDGKLMTAEIDGMDAVDTCEIAMLKARRFLDARAVGSSP